MDRKAFDEGAKQEIRAIDRNGWGLPHWASNHIACWQQYIAGGRL
jgi:hypothetical protein